MAFNLDSLLGVGTIMYLCTVALQSLVFSFQYSCYSFFAAGVVAVGELPSLFACGPLAAVASIISPPVRAVAYSLVSFGGICCFVKISWNPLLLAGHLLIGLLAARTFSSKDDKALVSKGYAPVHGYDFDNDI